MKYLKKYLYLVLLILFFIIFTISIQAEEFITLGVTSKKIALSKLESWQSILDEVSKRSGIDIELVVAKDHQTLIDLMRNKKIDLGYFSPVFYVKARNELNCKPIVLEKRLGSPYYRGGFIVHKNSKIKNLADLKGKKLALTAKRDSTSGYYLPIAILNRNNINYKDDLNVVYTGKHINVLKSVSYGLVDAGAIKLFILEDELNKEHSSQIRIIAKSSYLPTSSITAREDIKKDIINKLRKAFLSLDTDQEGLKAMQKSGFDGFAVSNDQMYDIVREYLVDYSK
ncbi:phosphate/phosphite/phosphonate ABC transporter substrate-binding protein [Halanaerobium congolense]|jgi:phosphonate transport system substrate-binding protein|uniref:Phosphonate transport system substrate-binding protein n=1 Tax=Halanaerobium congolense TaxID=54121 RepID=A0A1G6HT24_9FIRM|nr:phosphate/phosphite/phosphonate ABC transporter substrate-binding protein [Halanaerobium congolense]PUU88969.1 MAG: phosphonate transport system substrate-binding protein [Halanaerobium sp.]PTX16952.1 phosphonate transport system substrate-binding protein [Halanaerobium congolense]TDS33000.1 phosphonate transport system substrate-binding protein [Halanaerobium congolense]SDB97381.1 phosphonate transport system substrate-binding protein [Halanaerobium congolense]SDE64705.1 phosphonate transp